MEKIKVDVAWCDKNFGASLGDNVPGAVAVTAKTFAELQKEVKDTLKFHIEGMMKDGDDIPQWLAKGDYEFEYNFIDVAAMLRAYEPFVSLAAISRSSGINQHLLSHYANGVKKPRAQQCNRIVQGIHNIGKELVSASLLL